MKSERPSRTAHLVALGRAFADAGLSHVADFSDPTARAFLSERGQRSFDRIQGAAPKGNRLAVARSMADMAALRTAAIDRAVRDAIAGGATQLVILGAGYDGRAWRLPELAGVNVFEVDRAVTQRDKRARIAKLPAAVGLVNFVAIDFEHESLATVLDRAGHDSSSPTCWIWEGVTMYLTREAMHSTLADIARRSARGSTLIVNYHTGRRGVFARLMFRLIGEPQISAWTREEMAADLGAVGFAVHEDSGMTDWNERFAQRKANVERAAYMRLATARL